MSEAERACGCAEARSLERVRYFPRQLLTADDMCAEQDYARQRQRRFNRFVIGWGVVCGLEVKSDPDNSDGVLVCPGYALGPWGDEIYVPEAAPVPFGRRLLDPADPCQPWPPAPSETGARTIYVAIRFDECLTRPVRTSPAGCGCDDTACEYSRVRDGYRIDLLRALPNSHLAPEDPPPTLCTLVARQQLIPCPPCPRDPWVLLATLTFPAPTTTTPSPGFTIDCLTNRRILVSAAVAQAQILQFCQSQL